MPNLTVSEPNDVWVILESTTAPTARVQLGAVTSNREQQSQLQYRGTLILFEGIAGQAKARLQILPGGTVQITKDGDRGLHVVGAQDQSIDISSTPILDSRLRLMAVVSNGIPESQIQFNNQLSFVAPLAARKLLTVLQTGHVLFNGADGVTRIDVDGNIGDIVLKNADCAEDFDVAGDATLEPGTVAVIEEQGTLRPCERPYDRRVAGVASGAGGYRPGIVLDRQQAPNKRVAIAIAGKAYCKVDAQYAPIEIGDLLTTSLTSGHAMKADDPFKAFGSVIGKALRPLAAGVGLIPMLIALQ